MIGRTRTYCPTLPINTVVNSNNETHHTSLFRGRALVGVVRVSRDCCRKILSCLNTGLNWLGTADPQRILVRVLPSIIVSLSFFFF